MNNLQILQLQADNLRLSAEVRRLKAELAIAEMLTLNLPIPTSLRRPNDQQTVYIFHDTSPAEYDATSDTFISGGGGFDADYIPYWIEAS